PLVPARGPFLHWSQAWIGPAIVVHAFVISVVVSFVALAVSALTRSARVAGLAFFGLILGLEMVRVVLQQGFGRREAMLLSLQADLQAIGQALFGLPPTGPSLHWTWPVLGLGLAGLARCGRPSRRSSSWPGASSGPARARFGCSGGAPGGLRRSSIASGCARSPTPSGS